MSRFQRLFLIILIVYLVSVLGQAYNTSIDLFGFIILVGIGFYLTLNE